MNDLQQTFIIDLSTLHVDLVDMARLLPLALLVCMMASKEM